MAVLTVGVSLLAAMPNVRAPLSFGSPVLTPGQYTGMNIYVPGEDMMFTLEATPGEVYDVAIVATAPLTWYDDQVIPPSGQLTLTYTIPPTPIQTTPLPDGPYTIEVGDSNFGNSWPVGRLRTRTFNVQEYEFRIEVDRPAYLGGDRVIVSWSANRLKDGSLAPAGVGQIWVYNQTWQYSFLQPRPTPFQFTEPAGSTYADLPALTDANYEGIVMGWFNSTTAGLRARQWWTSFLIERLSAIVDVAPGRFPNVYAPNDIVTTAVLTVATDNQAFPFPWDPPQPGVTIEITVWDVTGGPGNEVRHGSYGVSGLVTDSRGELSHLFRLQSAPDGSDWEVRMNATFGLWTFSASDTFSVSAAAGINVVQELDRIEYQAGDSATVTAAVTGTAGGTLTYYFEVRDSTGMGCPTGAPGTLRGSNTITGTQTTAQFVFAIDPNFSGELCFTVFVDDGQGNRDSDIDVVDVVFGWLLVNANPDRYGPNQGVTFNWELSSNRIQSPRYFYEVRNSGFFPGDQAGALVTSGDAVTSFVFNTPFSPAPWYDVKVTAVEAGRAVEGRLTIFEVGGFALDVTLDRSSYARGDTIRVHYRIIALGRDPLPSPFDFRLGLENFPLTTVATARAEGDLEYVVPSNANEGSQEFVIFEMRSGAGASEVILIGGSGAWISSFSLFDIILLIFVLLMFLMLWRQGVFSGMRAPKAPKAPKEPAPPSRSEPVYAPPASPMTVTCRSCGSPIDITTSKRPIEVMCPKCGNTEMVA